MKHKAKPSFYKDLCKKDFFKDATIKVQYINAEHYWIFKTGPNVYKFKKPIEPKSSPELENAFCQEVVKRVAGFSPQLEPKMVCLEETEAGFVIADSVSNKSNPHFFGIAQTQLSDRGFVNSLLSKDKFKVEHAKAVGEYLGQVHQKIDAYTGRDAGSTEFLIRLLEADFYQAKKFLGQTLKPAMTEMTLHPFQKKAKELKKLLGSRLRKGKVARVQGSFKPSKIHVGVKEVTALGRGGDPFQNAFFDVASDVADLSVELKLLKKKDQAEAFLTQYIETTGDEDIRLVLPLYEILKVLASGLKLSLLMDQEEAPADCQTQAQAYFTLMVELARAL
ncbi:MAG: hypothetical protein QNL04_06405 [SAR324 cluster bacterium]|nr:hypothetical protein [SAR324 cluster bacterium]